MLSLKQIVVFNAQFDQETEEFFLFKSVSNLLDSARNGFEKATNFTLQSNVRMSNEGDWLLNREYNDNRVIS